MKRLIFSLILVMSIISIPLFASAEGNSEYFVPVDVAKDAVENYILGNKYFEEVKGSTAVLKHELYDSNDTLNAYYFELHNDGNKLGYFIVSASKLVNPILQYSIGGDLDYYFEQKESGDKIYYSGVNNFRFATDGKELIKEFDTNKMKHLETLKKIGLDANEPLFQEVQGAKIKSLKEGEDSINQWNNLIGNKDMNNLDSYNEEVDITGLDPGNQKVLPVDRIWQRRSGIKYQDSACGPTVGAMIMDYYHDVLGYNVRDNKYHGTWAELVNHLRWHMGSSSIGTYLNDFRDGIYAHVLETQSSSTWSKHSDSTPSISDLVSAINSNDPLGLQTDFYVDGGSRLANWHWYAAIGYSYYNGNYRVAYKNPDGGKTNDDTHWFDWDTYASDLDMAWLR